MSVSIHWESHPGVSHTLVVSERVVGSASIKRVTLLAEVSSYEDGSDVPKHGIVGSLDTVLPIIMGRRHLFTLGLLVRARPSQRDGYIIPQISSAVRRVLLEREAEAA